MVQPRPLGRAAVNTCSPQLESQDHAQCRQERQIYKCHYSTDQTFDLCPLCLKPRRVFRVDNSMNPNLGRDLCRCDQNWLVRHGGRRAFQKPHEKHMVEITPRQKHTRDTRAFLAT